MATQGLLGLAGLKTGGEAAGPGPATHQTPQEPGCAQRGAVVLHARGSRSSEPVHLSPHPVPSPRVPGHRGGVSARGNSTEPTQVWEASSLLFRFSERQRGRAARLLRIETSDLQRLPARGSYRQPESSPTSSRKVKYKLLFRIKANTSGSQTQHPTSRSTPRMWSERLFAQSQHAHKPSARGGPLRRPGSATRKGTAKQGRRARGAGVRLLVLARRLSLERVGHEASVGSLGDKGMPRSHNLKAQKAEGPEQGGCGGNRVSAAGGAARARSPGPRPDPQRAPLSSRFLWKQMKTWAARSCSSANSRRTARLKGRRQRGRPTRGPGSPPAPPRPAAHLSLLPSGRAPPGIST